MQRHKALLEDQRSLGVLDSARQYGRPVKSMQPDGVLFEYGTHTGVARRLLIAVLAGVWGAPCLGPIT